MTTIKETQIEALKDKIFAVLTLHNEDCNTDELVSVLVSKWIDENQITIIE